MYTLSVTTAIWPVTGAGNWKSERWRTFKTLKFRFPHGSVAVTRIGENADASWKSLWVGNRPAVIRHCGRADVAAGPAKRCQGRVDHSADHATDATGRSRWKAEAGGD